MNSETAKKDERSVEERRERIYEMHLKGSTEREIAEAVGVNQSTVSRSLEVVGKRNRGWFQRHWDQGSLHGSLLKEQRDRLLGLVREAWNLYGRIDEIDIGKKIQALSLVKNAVKDLGDMLGLELPSLSNPNNFDPLDHSGDENEEIVEIDLSREKVSRGPLPAAISSGSSQGARETS